MSRCVPCWAGWLVCVMAAVSGGQEINTRPSASCDPDTAAAASEAILVDLDVQLIDARRPAKVLPARFYANTETESLVLTPDELAQIHQACRTDQRIKVIAVPRLRLKAGTAGGFRKGKEIPLAEPNPSLKPKVLSTTANRTQFIGTALDATVTGPTSEGLWGVALTFERSTMLPGRIQPGSNPLENSTHIHSEIMLPNGQTAVLGGLQTEQAPTTESRVPVLGRLPVVGARWFTRKPPATEHSERLLLVTPVLVD